MTQKAVKTRVKGNEAAFTSAFSSFSVNDLNKAKEFYGRTLGLEINETKEGLSLVFENGQNVFIYPKPDHQPAAFTVLNFPVNDITDAVHKLAGLGVRFESFDGELKTDINGIFWGKRDKKGPNIAWFKDPAGNFLSLVED